MRVEFKYHTDALDYVRVRCTYPMGEILDDVFGYIERSYLDDVLIVTSIFRRDPGSVHGWWRGLDATVRSGEIERLESIRHSVNMDWDYGSGDYEVVPPVRHGTAPHCHFQVARNGKTSRREIT